MPSEVIAAPGMRLCVPEVFLSAYSEIIQSWLVFRQSWCLNAGWLLWTVYSECWLFLTLNCQEEIIYSLFKSLHLFMGLLFGDSLSHSSLSIWGLTWNNISRGHTKVWMDHNPGLCLLVQVWHIAKGAKCFLYPLSGAGVMHRYHRLQSF